VNEPHGLRVWFAVVGGIGAWMAHLIAMSALARRTCLTGEDWVLHAITVGLAAVTIWAMVLAARLRTPAMAGRPGQAPAAGRQSCGGRSGATPGASETRELLFLGKVGLLIGAINLVLIVFEGSLVLWIPTCG
jgi:hypothetical protein